MTQAFALAARVPSRALVGLLLVSTAAVGAMQAEPISRALSKLAASAAVSVIKPIDRKALFAPDTVQPFYLHAANDAERERAIRCMTDAVYYEAANEPQAGQRAVAQVVVNRVRDKHFPKSICGVVYEGWERSTGCQFSFVCDGSIRRRHADPALWASLRPLAEQALNGHVTPQVGTATHYYAEYVRPNWVHTVARITEIGKHIFCSWKGKAGQPAALDETYQGGEFAVADAALDGVRVEVKHTVQVVHHRIEMARAAHHSRVHSRLYA